MYNFEQHLTTNEQILYQGRAEPGKGGKSSKSLFIVLIMLIIIQIIMIASIQSNTSGGSGGISLNFIIIFLTTIVFEILIIYGIVYDLFLKKKEIKNVYYCLTNKRALEFDEKTNVLRFGHLIYYEEIKIYNEKNNYGDVYMGIILANQVGDAKDNLIKILQNPDFQNMPAISFNSIENPRYVFELVKKARMNLLSQVVVNK